MTLLYAYNFDEASGALIDYSGAGRNVTLAGSLVRTAGGTGHTDQGLSQTTTSADSVGPAISGLQTANYTVMAWVKRTTNALDGWFCEFKASGSGDRGILFLSGNIQSRARNSGGTVVGASAAQPTAGTWYHAAGSYDGTTLRLFINGTQVATAALAAPLKTTSTGSHLIDALGSETIIDDVRYYDAALTAGEISTLMTTPVTGATTATGTISGTLPSMVGSLTGSVRVSGTQTGTLPSITGSLTGTIRASGTVAASLPSMTGSLAASLKASGTAAAILPALTGSLTGDISDPATPVTGTLSGSLPAIQGFVSGGFTVSGTIPGLMPAMIAAVTVTVLVAASLAGNLPGLVASMTGQVGPATPFTPALTTTASVRVYSATATARDTATATVRDSTTTATVRSPA